MASQKKFFLLLLWLLLSLSSPSLLQGIGEEDQSEESDSNKTEDAYQVYQQEKIEELKEGQRALNVSTSGLKSSLTEIQSSNASTLTSPTLKPVPEQAPPLPVALMMQEVEKHLLQTRCRINAAIQQIPVEDPERSSKIAAIYVQAYQEAKPCLESLLAEINKNPESLDQEIALPLGKSAIQLLEMTFKTIKPIKIAGAPDDGILITPREIPWTLTPYEELKREDDEARFALYEANNIITDLIAFIKIFDLPASNRNGALRENLYFKAEKRDALATKRKWSAYRHALSKGPEKDPEFLPLALQAAKKAATDLQAAQATLYSPMPSTEADARRRAIEEILNMANAAVEKSDTLVSLFDARKG